MDATAGFIVPGGEAPPMLTLDGSAGGGQLLRTALSLAAVTGRGFTMTGIRERRPNPGLRPQHLAAVRILAEITAADVEGAEEGSTRLLFEPQGLTTGHYSVDVGTAGSLPLLFDTVLPLADALSGPLTVTATGGTDVRWAPCLDFLRHVKLPLLRRHGLPAAVDVHRRGFYPTGGGEATLVTGPATLTPLSLVSPGEPEGAKVYSIATEDLTNQEVATRQAAAAADRLADLDIPVQTRSIRVVDAASTGSAVVVGVDRGRTLFGGDALGERGTPAETVGERSVDSVAEVLEADAGVDVRLADQLAIYVALAGGQLSTPRLTDHLETSQSVLEAFGYGVSISREADRAVIGG